MVTMTDFLTPTGEIITLSAHLEAVDDGDSGRWDGYSLYGNGKEIANCFIEGKHHVWPNGNGYLRIACRIYRRTGASHINEATFFFNY